MKKLTNYTLIIMLMVIFVACSSDDKYELTFPEVPTFVQVGKNELVIAETSKEEISNGLEYSLYTIKKDAYRNDVFLKIHLVTLDITTSKYRPKILLAGEKMRDYKTPTGIAEYYTSATKNVVAAINGDYFHTGGDYIGLQMGVQFYDGRLYKTGRGLVYAFDEADQPFITTLSYELTANDMMINDVNEVRYGDFLVLFTPDFGPSTGTNPWGVELVLEPKDPNMKWEETRTYKDLIYVVSEVRLEETGNTPLADNHLVLSGHGAAATKLKSYSVGDEIVLNLKVTDQNTGEDFKGKTTVGGSHHILINGKPSDFTPSGDKNEDALIVEEHPRSAIGHSADAKKFFIVAVEGRLPYRSKGVDLPELADIMSYFGAHEAFNLDGGGSTFLHFNGRRVNWVPGQTSDDDPLAKLRVVPNAFCFVSE